MGQKQLQRWHLIKMVEGRKITLREAGGKMEVSGSEMGDPATLTQYPSQGEETAAVKIYSNDPDENRARIVLSEQIHQKTMNIE
jgi:hypothetical protein